MRGHIVNGKQLYRVLFIIGIILFLLVDCTTSNISFISAAAGLIKRYSLHYNFILAVTIFAFIDRKGRIILGDSINYLIPPVVFAIITLIFQTFNGFKSYSISELTYLFIPILVYIGFINEDRDKVKTIMDTYFYLFIIFFFIKQGTQLSWNNIKSISFVNSYSAFESKYAYYSVILMVYYIFKKDKTKTIASFLLCALSLKRVSLLFAIIYLIFSKRIPCNKAISKRLFYYTVIGFCIAPILIQIVCNEQFGTFFYNLFGLNLNAFMKGRVSRIYAVLNSDEIKYGWGSTTNYLSTHLWTFAANPSYFENGVINVHCDILRIYLECTIIGTVVFTYCNFKAVKDNWCCYLIMLYLFTDMLVNHHLGSGKVFLWIFTYTTIYSIKKESKSASISAQEEHYNG